VVHPRRAWAGGDELGGHAVQIIGWGTEDSQPYWVSTMRSPARPRTYRLVFCFSTFASPSGCGTLRLQLVVNSFGVTWGDKGFFKIIRGAGSAGIDQNVVAGLYQ
jgi:cathepsin B